MRNTRTSVEYLLQASQASLESFQLARMTRTANLRKELTQVVSEMVNAEVEVRLAHWLRQRRRGSGEHGEDELPARLLCGGSLLDSSSTLPPSNEEADELSETNPDASMERVFVKEPVALRAEPVPSGLAESACGTEADANCDTSLSSTQLSLFGQHVRAVECLPAQEDFVGPVARRANCDSAGSFAALGRCATHIAPAMASNFGAGSSVFAAELHGDTTVVPPLRAKTLVRATQLSRSLIATLTSKFEHQRFEKVVLFPGRSAERRVRHTCPAFSAAPAACSRQRQTVRSSAIRPEQRGTLMFAAETSGARAALPSAVAWYGCPALAREQFGSHAVLRDCLFLSTFICLVKEAVASIVFLFRDAGLLRGLLSENGGRTAWRSPIALGGLTYSPCRAC